MPLRDHFQGPLAERRRWDALHGAWPTVIVMALNRMLPAQYVAEPRILLGTPNKRTTSFSFMYEYEVRVFDEATDRRLVAAVEIVSPSHKERPSRRHAFVAKCASLLGDHACVAIVDLVTTRSDSLYAELLDTLGQSDPSLAVGSEIRTVRTGISWTSASHSDKPSPRSPSGFPRISQCPSTSKRPAASSTSPEAQ